MKEKNYLYSFFGRTLGPLAGLLLLCCILSITSSHFLTWPNFINVSQQAAINAIISIGMTFVILTAGIDLSVGSLLALAGIILASTLHAGVPLPLALLIALLSGTACGLVNGVMISWGKIPPFIVTLSMMGIARGLALVLTGGRPISGFSMDFRFFALGKFAFIPIPILLMILLYIASYLFLTKTRMGRYTYALGGNEQAVHLSGINICLYKTIIYGLSGLACAISAILLTARLDSAQPLAGINYELDAIASTVIGGTSLMGGEGNIGGTLIGVFIIQVIRNGLNLLNISSNVQNIVIGSVILLAAWLDIYLKSYQKRKDTE